MCIHQVGAIGDGKVNGKQGKYNVGKGWEMTRVKF
jgi:hypothetical protein